EEAADRLGDLDVNLSRFGDCGPPNGVGHDARRRTVGACRSGYQSNHPYPDRRRRAHATRELRQRAGRRWLQRHGVRPGRGSPGAAAAPGVRHRPDRSVHGSSPRDAAAQRLPRDQPRHDRHRHHRQADRRNEHRGVARRGVGLSPQAVHWCPAPDSGGPGGTRRRGRARNTRAPRAGRGAVTGALRAKAGLLEAANGGTMFLDELIEMPKPIQAKLLRVIQDGVVRRVGSESTDAIVNVRFIAATNRHPEDAVRSGTLREDLYYRLRVVPIHVPSLRDRPDDVPLLANPFLPYYWQRHRGNDAPLPKLSKAAVWALCAHSWPGNVRELQNVVEHAVVLI